MANRGDFNYSSVSEYVQAAVDFRRSAARMLTQKGHLGKEIYFEYDLLADRGRLRVYEDPIKKIITYYFLNNAFSRSSSYASAIQQLAKKTSRTEEEIRRALQREL
jgi:hypothetical protein